MINVNDLVEAIGESLLDILQQPWERVVVEVAKEDEQSTNVHARYEREGFESESFLLIDAIGDEDDEETLFDSIDEMWERYSSAGTPWKKAVFVVTSDGEARVSFEYDD